ncbi:MAG: hypothetical protein LQ352_000622 [Teloschistes flavicans]|nr:MAG: hypothetical protein LQ352_000622 [Teloschistes flavicans]
MTSISVNRNDFPVFSDGDCEIQLARGPRGRLLLHSHILELRSTFFKASLGPPWSADYPSVGTIKWRYELVVDDDGVGILRKRGLDAINPKDEWKMPPPPSPRYSASVEAHYRFFKMIYDCPIDIPVREGPEAVLENLSELVAVGDLYGGLDLLANAIEKFMGRYIGWFLAYFYLQGPAILGIAMRLKIVWLFKDMVCLACGDITRNSDRVRRDYEPIAASIILKKRKELRQMMTEINHDLLTMSTPKVEATSSKLLVAAFREMIIQMVKFTESKGWDRRGLIYSKDPAFYSLHQDCSERDKVTELDTVEEITFQDAKLCQEMGRDAAALTGPLHLNCLSELSSHGRNEGGGFTCIPVTDDDLPWKAELGRREPERKEPVRRKPERKGPGSWEREDFWTIQAPTTQAPVYIPREET